MSLLDPGAVRKSRNFKGLSLAESPLSIPIPRIAKPGTEPSTLAPSGASTADADQLASSFLEGDSDDDGPAPGPHVHTLQRRFQPKPAPVATHGPALDTPHPALAPATAPAAPGAPLPGLPPAAPRSAHHGTGFPKKPPGRLKKRAPANLKLELAPARAPGEDSASTAGVSEGSASYHNKLSEQLASLELAGAKRHRGRESDQAAPIELSDADLEFIAELGAGNGGTVTKVRHVPSNKVMAKKAVFIDAKPSVRKQILRELQIMHECDSPYIIDFFGAYLNEPRICMCMEYMDRGSLDQIYKRTGAIPPAICARVASVVVNGLLYLYDVHRIIHRDVKPSNILANSQGQLKLCDFGVSGELIDSIADTFVGTSTYMSPERIQGDQYSVKSDVWSLGVTLIELALGCFPFSEDDQGPKPEAMQLSILDLLQHIVNEPSPRLPPTADPDLRSFTDACLLKDPIARASPKDLLQHPLISHATCTNAEIASWLASFDS